MGLVTKRYTFTKGLNIDASETNRDFDDIYNAFNGEINSANIDTSYSPPASQVDVNDTAANFSSTGLEDILIEINCAANVAGGETMIEFSEGLVASIGTASQQMVGHHLQIEEPNHTATEVVALWHWDAASMTAEEKGDWPLTDVNGIANGSGILGINFAANFDGVDQYYRQGTVGDSVLDVFPCRVAIDFWVKPDVADAGFLFNKINDSGVAERDGISMLFETTGTIRLTEVFNGTGVEINTLYAFDTGTSADWAYICYAHDTANGMRLWVNGELETVVSITSTIVNAKNMPGDLNGSSDMVFTIGVGEDSVDHTAVTFFDGKIAQFRIRNKILTQEDVDIAYATRYAAPTTHTDTNYVIDASIAPSGNTGIVRQIDWPEVSRDTSSVYRAGGAQWTGFSASDRIRLVARS